MEKTFYLHLKESRVCETLIDFDNMVKNLLKRKKKIKPLKTPLANLTLIEKLKNDLHPI